MTGWRSWLVAGCAAAMLFTLERADLALGRVPFTAERSRQLLAPSAHVWQFDAATGAGGATLLAWTEGTTSENPRNHAYVQRFDTAGGPIGVPVQLDVVVPLVDGYETRGGPREAYVAYSPGSRSWLVAVQWDFCAPARCLLPVYVYQVNADGALVGDGRKVAGDAEAVTVAFACASASCALVSSNYGRSTLDVVALSADGAPLGPAHRLASTANSNDHYSARIVGTGSGFLAGYTYGNAGNAYLRHVSPAGVPDHSPIRLSQRPAGVPRRYNGQSGPPAFCALSPGRIFAMWGETWDHLGHHDSDPRDVPTQTRLSGSYAQMFDGDGRMLGGDRRRKRSMPEYTNGNLITEPVGGTCVDLRADNDAPGAHRRYQLMLRTLNRTGRPGPTHVVTTYARGVEPHDVVVTWSAGRGLVFEARVRLSSPSDVGPGLYVTPLK